MILVKFHESVVSLCDEEILGKHFEDEHHFLTVTERFYGGEKMTKKQVLEVFQTATSMNLVGKKVITLALEEGFLHKDRVIIIQGVPHAQIYAF